jgi:hypothetical protein
MKILEQLKEKTEAKGLDFLVIGGHAVSAHGFSRNTGDLDLAIKETDSSDWETIILGLGYKSYNKHKNFLQFQPPELGFWPIDLTLHNDQTFQKLLQTSVEKSFGGCVCKVPSIKHILAMKLHAIKNDPARMLKDCSDIVELSSIAGIDLSDKEFKNFCLKYGNIETYEFFRKTIK